MPVTGFNSQNVEDGTFTDCAAYLGTIRRGIGTMFSSTTGWTARSGAFQRSNNGVGYQVGSDLNGRARLTVNRSSANGNYRVSAQITVSGQWGGPIGRSDSLDAGDWYAVLLRVDTNELGTFRFDNDAGVQLAVTAQAFTAGLLYNPGLSFDGGAASQNVSAIETVTGATVARVADTTYTTGFIGVGCANVHFTAAHVYADHAPASCTYVSPTLDAGSSLAADVAGWGESLGTGNITIDADLRDSGNSGTYDATGLTTPTGSTFTEATGRYRNVRVNITGNGQLTQMPVIAKGNDADGGGATIYSSGGRSGQRTKKVYVAVDKETIKKLKNSFA